MRHILITGASTGIGHDLVKRFSQDQNQVWAGVRNPESLVELKNLFPNLKILKLDVTSSVDIQNAHDQILPYLENMDEFILVNNAGIAVGGPVEYLRIEDWREVFEVNVFGLFQVTKVFLPLLRQKKGKVINIGSLSGIVATPFLSIYAATKFAVRAFSDSLRREMMPFGVKVVLIQPGPIKTKIWGKSVDKSLTYQDRANEDLKKVYSRSISGLVSGVKKTEQSAISVDKVSDLITQVAYSSNPRSYYLIGKHIHLLVFLLKIMPTPLKDRLLNQGFRFVE